MSAPIVVDTNVLLRDGATIDGVRIRNPFSYSVQEASVEACATDERRRRRAR